ncbi:hypothetical protein L9F63_001170, partial [Diploptera punctata]
GLRTLRVAQHAKRLSHLSANTASEPKSANVRTHLPELIAHIDIIGPLPPTRLSLLLDGIRYVFSLVGGLAPRTHNRRRHRSLRSTKTRTTSYHSCSNGM